MNRIDTVDSVRFIAICGVISIHTEPFSGIAHPGDLYDNLRIAINQLARFAVPFFFVISGFFWGVKQQAGKKIETVTKAMASRIAIIFVVWSCIYLLPYNFSTFYDLGILGPLKWSFWTLKKVFSDPINLIFEGTKEPLWFLMGLLFAIYITHFFVKRKANIQLFIFASCLYIMGVLLKSYADTPLGLNVDFNSRNGPFFSTLLFASGYFLTKWKSNERWFIYGSSLFLLGIVSQFCETYFLMITYNTNMIQHDYVFGTYLMGVGAAIIALSNHKILQPPLLSKLGKMSLGIYVIHVIFIENLLPIDRVTHSLAWEIAHPILILLLSIGSVHLLSKIPIMRKVLS
jgi:surface polysaccharide O-acyltransferase-like enzyme